MGRPEGSSLLEELEAELMAQSLSCSGGILQSRLEHLRWPEGGPSIVEMRRDAQNPYLGSTGDDIPI